jgi:hypothetical protein
MFYKCRRFDMARRLKGPPRRPDMLQPGNTHVGWMIHTFSIPAFSTCPGASLACLLACYALKFLFSTATTLDAHRRNWERAVDDPAIFIADLVAEIRFKHVRCVRIHVAGDFFSEVYAQCWVAVARACPGVRFLFYTRSWRRPEILPALLELAALPNVYAWWSEDRDTGAAVFPVGRRCFLCVDAADEALVPPGVDLVFREDARRARKWAGGAWVCPKENGTGAGITCSSCLRCLIPGPLPVPPEMRSRDKGRPAPQPRDEAVSASPGCPG